MRPYFFSHIIVSIPAPKVTKLVFGFLIVPELFGSSEAVFVFSMAVFRAQTSVHLAAVCAFPTALISKIFLDLLLFREDKGETKLC